MQHLFDVNETDRDGTRVNPNNYTPISLTPNFEVLKQLEDFKDEVAS